MPPRVRGLIPLVVVLGIAVTYPLFAGEAKSLGAAVGEWFPALSSGVIILVFTMMAVGLNVVVGYAGLLDLGYVAFYAAGAYVAGWLGSIMFTKLHIHIGSVGDLAGAAGDPLQHVGWCSSSRACSPPSSASSSACRRSACAATTSRS